MTEDTKPSSEARELLLDGKLLETTEAVALKLAHNYEWARRMIEEIAGKGRWDVWYMEDWSFTSMKMTQDSLMP